MKKKKIYVPPGKVPNEQKVTFLKGPKMGSKIPAFFYQATRVNKTIGPSLLDPLQSTSDKLSDSTQRSGPD